VSYPYRRGSQITGPATCWQICAFRRECACDRTRREYGARGCMRLCVCACSSTRRHISAASLSRTIETDNVGQRVDRRANNYCVIISSRAVRLIKTCDDKTTRLRLILLLSSSSPRSLFSPSVFSRVRQQQRVSGAAGHHVRRRRRRDDNELLTNDIVDIVDVARNRWCRKPLVPLFLIEMIIRLQQPDSVSR
ncbi:Uncharacterized protein FWK35_00004170, partial [Aphis craccivora]